MKRSVPVLVFAAFVFGGASLEAQARPKPQDGRTAVPQTHVPPPGMCRIWLDNVPPTQQPAPTDCASAARNLPRNARLVYSDEPRNPRVPLVKSLKNPPPQKGPEDPKSVGPDGKRVKPPRPDSM